jgi:hypothetical protein
MKLDFEVPDLSGLGKHSTRLALRRFFQNAGPQDHTTYALVMNSVRLSDLAIREYEEGRSMLIRFATTTDFGLTYAIVASGHFEACLSALHRAFRHLDALRRCNSAPVELKRLIPSDLVERNKPPAREINDLRDATLHLDERITDGDLAQGEAACIMPTQDSLEIGKHRLSFVRLATWLRRLHECTGRVANWGATVTQ